jgi:Trk K+ transport system NAD-binding subunit
MRELAAEEGEAGPLAVDAVVFGLGRFGSSISRGLTDRGLRVLGVDFDPLAVRQARAAGLATQYGDAEDPELPAQLPLSRARWVVSTAPSLDVNLVLLHALREQAYSGRIAVTTHDAGHARQLAEHGADVVLLPYADAADQAVDLITADGDQHAPARTA